jgi:hypothetical protein
MEFIICLISISFIFIIYLNFNKIVNFISKKDKKILKEIVEEKISKRKKLGSPRRYK